MESNDYASVVRTSYVQEEILDEELASHISDTSTEHQPFLATSRNTSALSSSSISISTSTSTDAFLPDEGWRYPGWWTVLGIFLYNVFVWGVSDSWGVFQVLYLQVYAGQANEFLIALVGASVLSIAYGMGALALPVIQQLGYRLSIVLSSVIVCSALLFASTVQTVSAVFLTQGLLLGIGTGLGYTAITALPSQWFVARRSLANGLALSGTSIGSVCFSPIIQASIAAYGHRATLAGLGIAGSVILGLTTSMIRPATHTTKTTTQEVLSSPDRIMAKDIDIPVSNYLGLLRDNRAFQFYLLFCIVVPFGVLPPWFVAPMYAIEIGASPQTGAYCVSAMGAASAISRVVFGHLADRCGVINVLFLGTGSAGLLTLFLWPVAKTPGVFIIYCTLFGFTSGVHVGLRPSALATILGVDLVQKGISYAFPVSIVGALLGAPVMSALHQQFGWQVAIQMCGGLGVLSALVVVVVRSSLTNNFCATV